ncbi:colanic acid biosynthesis acetyltransferase WcaF [archaeon]|jgi:putative colanic acid biosynthesis acetyltransferase WcaF|nr:colanic acid biosynthesis acetyltransferase WcaF [archaeon]
MKTELSKYNNDTYVPGSKLKIMLWYLTNAIFFLNPFIPYSKLKIILLRLFGAKIGTGVFIKTCVNIKYPWKLEIGNYCWIGENVWIDNLELISIGNNVCISQGAMLLCGNHNYKKHTFNLITKPITLEEGAWVGAKSVVCPGVTLKTHSILSVGSVATRDLEAYAIYKGNPALKIKERIIKS